MTHFLEKKHKRLRTIRRIFGAQKHSFHLVDSSLYPFFVSLTLLFGVFNIICELHFEILSPMFRDIFLYVSIIVFSGFSWVLEAWYFSISRESRMGFHTKKVFLGLRSGMLLFILSEVMFFFAFFWAFFHFSLAPSIAIGNIWPPLNTQKLNVWGLPLVNTVLLLSSGVTITFAHQYILNKMKSNFIISLALTIFLGVCFLSCQFLEYKYGVKFSWRGNLYGSIFFITTGFHGLHVLIGTTLLILVGTKTIYFLDIYSGQKIKGDARKKREIRIKQEQRRLKLKVIRRVVASETHFWMPTSKQHFGFEAAAWYWHFVDVVWLFLFITIYWWGS